MDGNYSAESYRSHRLLSCRPVQKPLWRKNLSNSYDDGSERVWASGVCETDDDGSVRKSDMINDIYIQNYDCEIEVHVCIVLGEIRRSRSGEDQDSPGSRWWREFALTTVLHFCEHFPDG